MSPEKPSEKASNEFTGQTEQLTTIIIQARENTAKARSVPHLPKDKSVSLLVMEGPLKGKSFPINKPQVSLGRTKADIVLDDTKVSRTHCVVEVHETSGVLVDLDSGNGTFVDAKKVASCELEHLSEFRIGGTAMMFVVANRE